MSSWVVSLKAHNGRYTLQARTEQEKGFHFDLVYMIEISSENEVQNIMKEKLREKESKEIEYDPSLQSIPRFFFKVSHITFKDLIVFYRKQLRQLEFTQK
jgi:hypothetical protein